MGAHKLTSTERARGEQSTTDGIVRSYSHADAERHSPISTSIPSPFKVQLLRSSDLKTSVAALVASFLPCFLFIDPISLQVNRICIVPICSTPQRLAVNISSQAEIYRSQYIICSLAGLICALFLLIVPISLQFTGICFVYTQLHSV